MRLGAELVRAIAACVRAASLYPSGHPVRDAHAKDAIDAASMLFVEAGSLDLFAHQDSFFIGERLLGRESIAFQWLLRRMSERGITSIRFSKVPSVSEIAQLAEYIDTPGQTPPADAIKLNAAQLLPAHLAGAPQDRARTAYTHALDLMREIGPSVAGGKRPNLSAAGMSVEGLVDAVLTDPASTLLMSTIRAHDEYTFFHMVNVCILAVATGASVGFDRGLLTTLGLGALLHDMGKVNIPPEVLNQQGTLDESSWQVIRRHPVDGAALILQSWDRVDPVAARVAYEHHQRLNSQGYPEPVLGDGAPNMLSRIVAVADTYDAITSRRAYRRAEQRQRALEILMAGAGQHYDPRVVRVFVRMLGFFPPGSIVELDDGSIALVVKSTQGSLERPKVRVLRGPQGESIEHYDLDLASPSAIHEGRAIVRGRRIEDAGAEPLGLD